MRAIAQAKAAISRAMATTTWFDVLASRAQLPIPLTQAHVGLPAAGRQLLQPQLQLPADLHRVSIGPRPFDERAPGVGVPGLGDAPLPSRSTESRGAAYPGPLRGHWVKNRLCLTLVGEDYRLTEGCRR